jgi:hypothetical protein
MLTKTTQIENKQNKCNINLQTLIPIPIPISILTMQTPHPNCHHQRHHHLRRRQPPLANPLYSRAQAAMSVPITGELIRKSISGYQTT